MVKQFIRKATKYRGLPETEHVRHVLAVARRAGWPYCPDDEGDVLFRFAKMAEGQPALEVGFATGSTAAYMLSGLGSGNLTSVDYDQNHFDRAGEKLISAMGFSSRHRLVEKNSIQVLPALLETGARFGLVFLDGWKTFDHLWVDVFYAARMLNLGGHLILDDAGMPAVRKCVSLLRRYYQFQDIDSYRHIGGTRLRAWHLMTTRSARRPYVVLQKTMDVEQSAAGRTFDFWMTF